MLETFTQERTQLLHVAVIGNIDSDVAVLVVDAINGEPHRKKELAIWSDSQRTETSSGYWPKSGRAEAR